MKRCAIYTRKSSEEGLEQDFNSLAAQREACEAYITSQRSEGWQALPEMYDDGGVSGGTLNRPSLQRLLDSIDAGKVDVVVVYKVDRLTRSLADFAKLIERFDAHSVSVVAVTQPFNTTTSMGRLTLNVLLSFAQFEREITGERIRDKIAASKQKGMWMGGCVPLGYDTQDRKLIVNEAEAEKVRHIYKRYLALGSVYHLMRELERDGIRSKARIGRDGQPRGNANFSRGALYPLLHNRIYLGEIEHKGEVFPGDHDAIINRPLFDAVQAKLETNRNSHIRRAKLPSLLTGKLYDAAGNRLYPCHANKGGKRYRYYVSKAVMNGGRSKTRARWPAQSLETFIRQRVAQRLSEANNWVPTGSPLPISRTDEIGELQRRLLDDSEGTGLLARLIHSAQLSDSEITLTLDPAAIRQHVAIPEELELTTSWTEHLLVSSRHNGERRVLAPDQSNDPNPNHVRALVDAHQWHEKLLDGTFPSVAAMARALGRNSRHVKRVLGLVFLSPHIKHAILDGTLPNEVDLKTLSMCSVSQASFSMQQDWLDSYSKRR